MVYFNETYAEVKYDPARELVEIIWKDPDYDRSRYCLTLSKAYVLMKQNEAAQWLLDLSHRQTISSEEWDWLGKYLIPNVAKNGIAKMAFIVPAYFHANGTEHSLKQDAQSHGLKIEFFAEKEVAYLWFEQDEVPQLIDA